jgi:hypothetical protein
LKIGNNEKDELEDGLDGSITYDILSINAFDGMSAKNRLLL